MAFLVGCITTETAPERGELSMKRMNAIETTEILRHWLQVRGIESAMRVDRYARFYHREHRTEQGVTSRLGVFVYVRREWRDNNDRSRYIGAQMPC